MARGTFTVLNLLDLELKDHNSLELRVHSGTPGLSREIRTPDLNRPGLAISGFFDNFGSERIQIFGRGERAYLVKLANEGRTDTLERLFEQPVPCAVFTHDQSPTADFERLAEAAGCPILVTPITTSELTSRLIRALSAVFAPRTVVHGVLVEVFGIGVLIQGDSGIGKSETALELIERGHRLVADDAVEILCTQGNVLNGQSTNPALGHHMEIRGLGIINITDLFGVGAIRDRKQVQLVAELETWDMEKSYDRLGSEEQTTVILGVHVPQVVIPVRPGRNIPIIIETAAMNERLKKMGYHSAQEFDRTVLRWLESRETRSYSLRGRHGPGTSGSAPESVSSPEVD